MRCAVFCFLFVCVSFAHYVEGLKKGEKGVCTSKHTAVRTRPKTVVVAINKWCGKRKCTVKQTRQEKYTVENHRLMCCKGFMYSMESDSCVPVCSTGCLNGTCTDPDVCHCTPPMHLDAVTKNKCITPSCDHPCINSQCTMNNTCTCLKEFTPFNSTHCAPHCTAGFELSASLSCVPKCENCTNGRCTAPSTCTCDPGYKMNGTCQPQCDFSCKNGFCASPNACQCFNGYIAEGKDCIPKCDDCDGLCVAPNVCKCKEGYAKVNGTCFPTCKEKCVNGRCSAPNVCSCDDGLIKKNATFCYKPTCGECRANKTCLLNTTITKTRNIAELVYVPCGSGRHCPKNVTKTEEYYEDVPIPICCTGYEWDEIDDGKEVCNPVCNQPCEGGRCTAPDQCTCDAPLVLVNNKCIIPVCDYPCINGQCTAPNTCTCQDGYYLKDKFTCAAQCTNCTNGECTAPNVCECHKGYTMKEGKCTPECNTKCSHGYCSAPNVCSCDTGYQLMDSLCKPVCSTPCVNATCVAPDVCECFDGYEPKERLKGICKPKCSSCAHGECVAPNECFCSRGYALIEGDCTPICKEMCINGHCSAPNKCTCKDGYKLNETEPFVCYKPCDVCNFGTCNLDGECICEDEFELVNGTCLLLIPIESAGIASTPGLAGLELTWLVGGAVCLLLVVLVIVAIDRIWRRRKHFGTKAPDNEHQFNSVLYTIPDTLIRNPEEGRQPDNLNETDEEDTSKKLMRDETDNV